MFAVIAVYMIGRAVNDVTINGIFGAGGDTMFDMYSLAVCMWCLAIPLAVAGTYFFHWPVVLVYACTCIDEVGKLPWVLYHFRKYKWVKDLTHQKKCDKMKKYSCCSAKRITENGVNSNKIQRMNDRIMDYIPQNDNLTEGKVRKS